MKRSLVLILVLACLLGLVASASAWQGRMGAMQNPYGFVADESDFLIHPSVMRNFEDITLFTHLNFDMNAINDFTYDLEGRHINGGLTTMDTTLDGFDDALSVTSGLIWPFQFGNLGFMFTYEHDWSHMEGDMAGGSPTRTDETDVDAWANDFIFSMLFATDVNENIGIGLRADLAYRTENVDVFRLQRPSGGTPYSNYMWDRNGPLVPLPQRFRYGSADFALSVDGVFSEYSFAATLYGGFLFAGMDYYKAVFHDLGATPESGSIRINNSVNGWNIGGDLWFEYALSEDMAVPILFEVAYDSISSSPNDVEFGSGDLAATTMETEYEERSFSIGVTSGLEYQISGSFLLGVAVSYSYANSFARNELEAINMGIWSDHRTFDDAFTGEHIFSGKLFCEYEVSDFASLNAGIEAWISSMTITTEGEANHNGTFDERTMFGSRFGIAGSIGVDMQFDGLSIEPFVSVGLESTNLSGQREFGNIGSAPSASEDLDYQIRNWFVTTGVTLAFDMF